jgi:5-methylcytosine-specific restriction endonuclease McrA
MHTEARCGNCKQYIQFLSKEDKYGTKEQECEIWEKTKGRCGYCGTLLNPFKKNGYTYDHVICQNDAKKNGEQPDHTTTNLMPSCKSCNSSKGKKTLGEYRMYKAKKHGTPTYVFYYEIIKYSAIGDILRAMYPSK